MSGRPVPSQLDQVLPRFSVQKAGPYHLFGRIQIAPFGKGGLRILAESGYSIQHETQFDNMPKAWPNCQQLTNPLYNGPVFRALAVDLDQWVSFGVAPPDSVVPLARTGTLVPPESIRFPPIPATA